MIVDNTHLHPFTRTHTSMTLFRRYELSVVNFEAAYATAVWESVQKRTFFFHSCVTSFVTLCPFTHIYSFDVGFPAEVMLDIASLFNRSATSLYYCSFHAPNLFLSYGFNVTLVGSVSTSMHGSGEKHTLYVYKRKDPVISQSISISPSFLIAFSLLRGRVSWWTSSRKHAASASSASSAASSRVTRLTSPESFWKGEGEGGGEGGGEVVGLFGDLRMFCHQCVRKVPMLDLRFCCRCTKRYCPVCLKKHYPTSVLGGGDGERDGDWLCVSCLGLCNCGWGKQGKCGTHPIIRKDDMTNGCGSAGEREEGGRG